MGEKVEQLSQKVGKIQAEKLVLFDRANNLRLKDSADNAEIRRLQSKVQDLTSALNEAQSHGASATLVTAIEMERKGREPGCDQCAQNRFKLAQLRREAECLRAAIRDRDQQRELQDGIQHVA